LGDFEGENKALQLGVFRRPEVVWDLRGISCSSWLSLSVCELEVSKATLALRMGDDKVLLNAEPELLSSILYRVSSSGKGRVMEKRFVREAEGGVIWIPDAEVHEAVVNRDLMCDGGVAGNLVGEAGGSIVFLADAFSAPCHLDDDENR
jgi:hypothetical protein